MRRVPAVVILVSLLTKPINAEDWTKPDWLEWSTEQKGDDLWVVGKATASRTQEVGRLMALKSARSEVAGSVGLSEEQLVSLYFETTRTYEEAKADGTFDVWRLCVVSMESLARAVERIREGAPLLKSLSERLRRLEDVIRLQGDGTASGGLVRKRSVAGGFELAPIEVSSVSGSLDDVRKDMGDGRLAEAEKRLSAIECSKGAEQSYLAWYERAVKGDIKDREVTLRNILRVLDECISVDSSKAFAFNLRGIIWAELGEDSRAVEDYGKALALRGDSAVILANRAESRKSLLDTLADADQALRVDANYWRGYVIRCRVLSSLGAEKAALEDCTKSVRLRPGEATTYHERARVLASLGDSKNSALDRQKACSLGLVAACR